MLKIVSDHVKTKRMHNKRICNKVVFDSLPNHSETQKMCDKAADDYAHALKFVPEWYKALII